MDFALTEEQVLLRDTARRLLNAECPPSLVRGHIDDRSLAGPDGLWRHLGEWTELGDGPLVDLCLFVEETGAVAAPGPFFATTALWGGLRSVHGRGGIGTVAIAGASGEWTVNEEPVKTFVLDADLVDHIGFVVGRADRPSFGVAPAASVGRREVGMLDPSRRVFEVTVPDDFMGEVMGDLSSRRGHIAGIESRAPNQVVRALVPLAHMFGYSTDLRSKTQGRASYSMEFSHYEEAPQSVVESISPRARA